MGREKGFRPRTIIGGLRVTDNNGVEIFNVDSTGNLDITGNLNSSGRVESGIGFVEGSIVTGTTATNLVPYGLSIVTGSGSASKVYTLTAPAAAGVHKYITVDTFAASTQSFTITINNATTAVVLNGSSFSAISLTTAALNTGSVHLIAETVTNWAIAGLPSGASLSTQ